MFPAIRRHFAMESDLGGCPKASAGAFEAGRRERLNLLLAHGEWRNDSYADLLPPLLQPLGVRCIRSRTATEARNIIVHERIHIAVVDLSTPADDSAIAQRHVEALGSRVLQLLRALTPVPPMVVVRPPQISARESARGLVEALREGAFSVHERPVPLESMLETLRRVIQRHYAGHWPAN
ncbi:MAG: hypothetical protein EXS15_02580 [Phycisphaerales bacterium]|nr:hypothetical protein [Phycisphaerales bacterium]